MGGGTRRGLVSGVVLSALLGLAGAARAAGLPIAYDDPALQAPETITVSVADIAQGGPIPQKFVKDGKNVAPPVRWSAGPRGTKSYALIVQDPDGHGAEAVVHWLVYDIPDKVLSLPGGLRNTPTPANPLGVAQGWNSHDSVGYTGPHPPQGDEPHHYHFQVFALDRALHVHPGAHVGQLTAAMKSHVLARGELLATYAAPMPSTKFQEPQG